MYLFDEQPIVIQCILYLAILVVLAIPLGVVLCQEKVQIKYNQFSLFM